MFVCAVTESMRRKGIIEIAGDGKLSSDNTRYNLTALGKAMGEHIFGQIE